MGRNGWPPSRHCRFIAGLWWTLCWNGVHSWSNQCITPFQSRRIAAPPSSSSSTCTRPARRQVDDSDDYYDDNYWQEDDRPQPIDLKVDMDDLEDKVPRGSGVYNVYFQGNEQVDLDWELCDDGSTWVLLPPPYVSEPKAVIHFVGGIFFGSAPKLWYKTLLEGIVRATQSTIVATPIPVTLLKNPLQHVALSKKLQRQFQSAYQTVLEDEYGELTNVPVVGMGHSLGARLLTVLATLSEPKNSVVPPYQSYILMSFTNYGSAASIPGIQTLLRQSKRLEEKQWDEPIKREPRRDPCDDDDDDEEWAEIMDEFQDALLEQAQKVQTALTPRPKELEFYPPPDQLWRALKDDKRYHVPETLIVQFDLDTIDQSPRLTDCLIESSNIKYARLHGTHLTPVQGENDWLPSRASQALWKLVRGRQSRATLDNLRDLRQSIARYIADVVAK